MSQYKLWVRVSPVQTTYTMIYAENDYAARQLAESQFGAGNLLGYWKQ